MMTSRRVQSGYMIEIPLILAAVTMLLVIVVPLLPVVFGKALVVVGAVVWIGGLYYMIVIPGLRPGHENPSRWRQLWRLTMFLGIAGLLSFVVGAYVLKG